MVPKEVREIAKIAPDKRETRVVRHVLRGFFILVERDQPSFLTKPPDVYKRQNESRVTPLRRW